MLEKFVQIVLNLINPALVETLLRSAWIDFSRDGNHTGNVASLWLSARHAAQTSRDEQFASRSAALLTRSIQNGDGRAVNDALWSDVHIGASRHLSVLCHPESIETFPIVWFAVVWNHHAVGNDNARRILVAWEQSHRMTAIHDQSLVVFHVGEILHHKAILSPVLEDGAIATVDDQLVRMLSHGRIQVVLNHQHDSCGLLAFARIFVNRTGIHLIGRAETVHVDAAVFFQFFGKFGGQHSVVLGRKIAQGVADGELLFFLGQDVLAFRGMIDILVVFFHFRQFIGDTSQNLF